MPTTRVGGRGNGPDCSARATGGDGKGVIAVQHIDDRKLLAGPRSSTSNGFAVVRLVMAFPWADWRGKVRRARSGSGIRGGVGCAAGWGGWAARNLEAWAASRQFLISKTSAPYQLGRRRRSRRQRSR